MLPCMSNDRQSIHEVPHADELREVFARFGRAYYYAEVLSRGLLALCALYQLPKVGPITRPRVEELLSEAFKLTMGQAVKGVCSRFPPEIAKQLNEAVEKRNFLAHHFWYERAHLMTSKEGVREMINELEDLATLFQCMDAKVDCVLRELLTTIGCTEAMIAQGISEVMAGQPIDPLPKARRPSREVVVIGVFQAPSLTSPGKHVLVFQTQDGSVWQLCDAGLGWSAYQNIDAGWKRVEKFADVLPARVNPRPPLRGPWHYNIDFGKRATLEVRPGMRPGEVIYALKRSAASPLPR